MGLACALLQSNLPAATVAAVQRVIASEATHRAGIAPCTLALSTGDTKAEENGWDSNPIALAAAWLSGSNSAPTWLAAAQSYLANIYTVSNTAGDPLANWVSTVTLFPEFALENHGFYHPTYEMVAGMSAGDSLLMARLAGTNATQMLPYANHNVEMVWTTNLSDMLFDSGEFAYPSGLDWELHDYEQDSYLTWMAAHFNDPVARWADAQMAQLVRYRQNVNSNGMFVGVSGGGFYREAVEARRTAIAWLQWANADYAAGPTNPPQPVVSFFPDVQVIAQRSRLGFCFAQLQHRLHSEHRRGGGGVIPQQRLRGHSGVAGRDGQWRVGRCHRRLADQFHHQHGRLHRATAVAGWRQWPNAGVCGQLRRIRRDRRGAAARQRGHRQQRRLFYQRHRE